MEFDFSGWATKNDLKCSDGRVIRKDAFKHNDGQKVPLVWNHDHTDPYRVLGHALLENRNEGVYAYCKFNETDLAQTAKIYVEHGDITNLSIYANQLKQQGPNVMHGSIREVSLVMAGANPGACIENVMKHDEESEEEAIIYTNDDISLYHSADNDDENDENDGENEIVEEVEETDENVEEAEIAHADGEDEETVADVINTFNEKQKKVFYGVIGKILEEHSDKDDEEDKEDDEKNEDESKGGNEMKQNVFEHDEVTQNNVLSHADQEAILDMARKSNVGSFKEALRIFGEERGLAHGLDLADTETFEELLPDYKNLTPGAPEVLGPDQSWVMAVINKIHKSPYSRIRTRHADARASEIREKLKAKAYTKGEEKKLTGNLKLIGRSHDPQTIYIKDELHRDDIIDITDFSIVEYVWKLMKENLYETLALAVLVGDGREDTDPDKIKEEHVQSIWHDEELYTIHRDVDVEAMRATLQGTETDAHFGENYIYSEAVIQEALYAREKFKGSGRPDFYCAPHLVNVMLLARDLNGRRIYNNKADLVQALNVAAIHEIEQLDGLTRKTEEGETKKLLGIFVNLSDYQFGSTKGGEVAKFEDFDIDFNKYKYLMETRLSGALVKLESAIALEEPVETEAAG